MKMILAAAVTMLAVSANAGEFCNPEQSYCPPDRVAGVPSWVAKLNKWFEDHLPASGDAPACNPEQSYCPPDRVAGVPKWVEEMNKWAEEQGWEKTNPFDDTTGQ
jgi:hypothetical protein